MEVPERKPKRQKTTYNSVPQIPLSPTLSPNIHIIGSLYLPHPKNYFPPEQGWVPRIMKLLPHLHRLDTRDLRKLHHRPIVDLHHEFTHFKRDEEQAWVASGVTPEIGSELVYPSGSLDSLIAHHLHQPSFASSTPPSPEVADRANPCITMVTGNGFREGQTLIYDHIHRRAKKSDGLDAYPQNVIDVHENFTHKIIESSAAKAIIVYGKPAQNRILQRMKVTTVPLWGRFEGVFLFLLHENNFKNRDEDYLYRKCLLFAAHPQRMFYQRQKDITSIRQDLTLEVAVSIADPTIKFDPEYYQNRKWEANVSMSRKSRNLSYLTLRVLLSSLQEPLKLDSEPSDIVSMPDSTTMANHWSGVFSPKPYSNRKTRSLLSAAVKAIEADRGDEWENPSHCHPDVLAWLKGQQEVIFHCVPISCVEDIASTIERYGMLHLSRSEESDKDYEIHRPGLKEMLKALMLAQQAHLNSLKPCKHDHLLFNRFMAEAVKVKCPCGLIERTDSKPRFSCARPTAYVAYRKKCQSLQCNPNLVRLGTLQILQPESNDIEFVVAAIPSLTAEGPRRVAGKQFASVLRNLTDIPTRPLVVESWCIVCKEKTQLSDGSSVYLDKCAMWTIGYVRPLYVERRPRCLRCERTSGRKSRFIPKSPDIPSITPRGLDRFIESYHSYDKVMQATLFDSYLPATRIATNLEMGSDEKSDVEEVKEFNHNNDGQEIQYDSSEENGRHLGIRRERNTELQRQLSPERSLEGSRDPNTSKIKFPTDTMHGQSSQTEDKNGQMLRKPLRLLEHSRPLLRMIRDDCKHLPAQVQIWCQSCKEFTKISPRSNYGSSADNRIIDRNPKWTIGEPPTYIGVKAGCLNCSKCRFIAMDKSIPTIGSDDLRMWADRHANLSDEQALDRFQKRALASMKRNAG